MKRYILEYMGQINDFIARDLDTADDTLIRDVLTEFEKKISYFQHERLIHLIVTLLFAILEMMSVYAFIVSSNTTVILFCVLFLVLLVPYVMHYYFLENSVQEMYRMRDKIILALKRS